MFSPKSNTPNINLPVVTSITDKNLGIYVSEDEFESTKKSITFSSVGMVAKADEFIGGYDTVTNKKATGYFENGEIGAFVTIKSNIQRMIDGSFESVNQVQIKFSNTPTDIKTAYIGFNYSDLNDKRFGKLGTSMISSTSTGLVDAYLGTKVSVERVKTRDGTSVLFFSLSCHPDLACASNCACGTSGYGVNCSNNGCT